MSVEQIVEMEMGDDDISMVQRPALSKKMAGIIITICFALLLTVVACGKSTPAITPMPKESAEEVYAEIVITGTLDGFSEDTDFVLEETVEGSYKAWRRTLYAEPSSPYINAEVIVTQDQAQVIKNRRYTKDKEITTYTYKGGELKETKHESV